VKLTTFQSVMNGLHRNEVRFLLVGGMAVVAHGYGRMTYDIDLVIQLTPANIRRTFEALTELDFRPRVPVTIEEFLDSTTREKWAREKGMIVLNFFSEKQDPCAIDLFIREPFPFDETFAKAVPSAVNGVPFRYVDLNTLIQMKRAAGRPVDLEDVRQLEHLAADHEKELAD
jgi:hypothetical protein